jgi:hypothetical protein
LGVPFILKGIKHWNLGWPKESWTGGFENMALNTELLGYVVASVWRCSDQVRKKNNMDTPNYGIWRIIFLLFFLFFPQIASYRGSYFS